MGYLEVSACRRVVLPSVLVGVLRVTEEGPKGPELFQIGTCVAYHCTAWVASCLCVDISHHTLCPELLSGVCLLCAHSEHTLLRVVIFCRRDYASVIAV